MYWVDLGESFLYCNEYLIAKVGFDTGENESCKVCLLSVYRSRPLLLNTDPPRYDTILEAAPQLTEQGLDLIKALPVGLRF